MCATGNSGGSAAIAYAVYEYGLDTELKMIEPTSGPVMSRIDLGCSPARTPASFLKACTGMRSKTCRTQPAAFPAAMLQSLTKRIKPRVRTRPLPAPTPSTERRRPSGLFRFRQHSVSGSTDGDVARSDHQTTIRRCRYQQRRAPRNISGISSVPANRHLQCLPGVAHDIPSFTSGR